MQCATKNRSIFDSMLQNSDKMRGLIGRITQYPERQIKLRKCSLAKLLKSTNEVRSFKDHVCKQPKPETPNDLASKSLKLMQKKVIQRHYLR